MSGDAVFVEGKEYVSVRKAAEVSGYARDYVGQMARGGLIQAQRIGGLWYVDLSSLEAYQKDTADAPVRIPPQQAQKTSDAVVSLDGRDYISASRAASITGYNQDYIGQLARGGKILSRQIGNRWYVEREALLAHKNQKDSLLASVQAESVGLVRTHNEMSVPAASQKSEDVELMSYFKEDKPLMPSTSPSAGPKAGYEYSSPFHASIEDPRGEDVSYMPAEHRIPIRVTPAHVSSQSQESIRRRMPAKKMSRAHGKSMFTATKTLTALTFVIVLSYGISTLKDGSSYANLFRSTGSNISQNAFVAPLSDALETVIEKLEKVIVPEISYKRK